MKYKGRNGNLYIEVDASDIPTDITDEERKILEKLRLSDNFKS